MDDGSSTAFCFCIEQAGAEGRPFLRLPFCFFDREDEVNMSLLEWKNVSHTYGDKEVYRHASFSLFKGEHVGVVGDNGAGKSTLIGISAGEIIPDSGSVLWQPGIRVGYLDQYAKMEQNISIRDFLRSAYRELFALEEEMRCLYELSAEGDEKALQEAAQCQSTLEAGDFYSIEYKIEKIAGGLGLQALGLEKKISEISGGQRAKVILAKLLLQEPEVLLLDEPTNFLDKEHVEWLSEFLAEYDGAFLTVSHDAAFLEKIADHICDVHQGEIRKYAGSYSDFLRQRERFQADYIRRYEAQKKEIEKTEAFIRKNIAGVNTRIAKGRRKQLARVERMAPPAVSMPKPTFRFQEAPLSAGLQLIAKDLLIGYMSPLLQKLNFSLKAGEKMVITGFNGIGKSTLLKTLVGELSPLGGSVWYGETVIPGYYAQELLWPAPEQKVLEIFRDALPSYTEQEIRRIVFRCGISSEHVLQKVGTLSGGEQAKIKLGVLMQRPCNFLLLDEPTNHLDRKAKESLREALTTFKGTVLLVSHEEEFYRDFAWRVVNIEKLSSD